MQSRTAPARYAKWPSGITKQSRTAQKGTKAIPDAIPDGSKNGTSIKRPQTVARDTKGYEGILRDTKGYYGILRDTKGH